VVVTYNGKGINPTVKVSTYRKSTHSLILDSSLATGYLYGDSNNYWSDGNNGSNPIGIYRKPGCPQSLPSAAFLVHDRNFYSMYPSIKSQPRRVDWNAKSDHAYVVTHVDPGYM
jgi:hypothetical protein